MAEDFEMGPPPHRHLGEEGKRLFGMAAGVSPDCGMGWKPTGLNSAAGDAPAVFAGGHRPAGRSAAALLWP